MNKKEIINSNQKPVTWFVSGYTMETKSPSGHTVFMRESYKRRQINAYSFTVDELLTANRGFNHSDYSIRSDSLQSIQLTGSANRLATLNCIRVNGSAALFYLKKSNYSFRFTMDVDDKYSSLANEVDFSYYGNGMGFDFFGYLAKDGCNNFYLKSPALVDDQSFELNDFLHLRFFKDYNMFKESFNEDKEVKLCLPI